MTEPSRTREQAIDLAVAFLKSRGIVYHELGTAVYRSRESFDRIATRLRDDFIASDPRRLDSVKRKEFLRELGVIQGRWRPHWSVGVIYHPMTDDLNPHVIIYDDSDEAVLE